MSQVIAVLCSDLHFSLRSPSFRSLEPSWLDAMQRPVDEMRAVAEKYNCPIVCAGDIWDKYSVAPEVINWAIKNLPVMYAVPGQHDLPNHRLDDIRKSAYYTLCAAGTIVNLEEPYKLGYLTLYPFPWGAEVKPIQNDKKDGVHLAVIHRYIWKNEKTSYYGAPEEKKSTCYVSMLEGFDSAVFGDNHIGFTTFVGQCVVMNCGTFMVRKADEVLYKPQIGLLYEDGDIVPHFLDTSKDVYVDYSFSKKKEDAFESELDSKRFMKELAGLGADALNFKEAVGHKMDILGTSEDVRSMVMEALG